MSSYYGHYEWDELVVEPELATFVAVVCGYYTHPLARCDWCRGVR